MTMYKGMILKKRPQFCFCKSQDLCVEILRNTSLDGAYLYRPLLTFEPSSIALSPLFQHSPLLTGFLSHCCFPPG